MRATAPGVSGFQYLAFLRGGSEPLVRHWFEHNGERGSTSGRNGVMALAGVEGAVGGDGGDLLPGRDLVEQLGQHGGVGHVAGGELGGPDLQ